MTAKDVYASQPSYENELALLRPIVPADAPALLKCYGDPHAAPFFNADHCNGDDFRYTTPERMAEAMAFWAQSYRERQFVRWAVEEHALGEAVGTVEMFARTAGENGVGVLRIDLRSRFETRTFLYAVLKLCLAHFYEDFMVESMVTKAVPGATERREALASAGFTPAAQGPSGLPFYFERKR